MSSSYKPATIVNYNRQSTDTVPTKQSNQITYTTINPFIDDQEFNRGKPQTLCNPIIIIPGYGATQKDYVEMVENLKTIFVDQQHFIHIVPVELYHWLSTIGGKPVTSVLKLIDETIRNVLQQTNSNHVTLIGHSAGGWISRIYLGDIPYPLESSTQWDGKRFVNQLICLGTPHNSSEPVTKKNMHFVNYHYPHAFYSNHIDYYNFAGDAVPIHRSTAESIPVWKFWHPKWMSKLSYQLTDPLVLSQSRIIEGDGIVPLSVTFLKDALMNVRLNGVWHSVDGKGPWYGDERVVRYWSQFLK